MWTFYIGTLKLISPLRTFPGVFALLHAFALLRYVQSHLSKSEFRQFFLISVIGAAGIVFLGVVGLTYAGKWLDSESENLKTVATGPGIKCCLAYVHRLRGTMERAFLRSLGHGLRQDPYPDYSVRVGTSAYNLGVLLLWPSHLGVCVSRWSLVRC